MSLTSITLMSLASDSTGATTAFCLPFAEDESATVVAEETEGERSLVSSTSVRADNLEEERVREYSGGGRTMDEEVGEEDVDEVEARFGSRADKILGDCREKLPLEQPDDADGLACWRGS